MARDQQKDSDFALALALSQQEDDDDRKEQDSKGEKSNFSIVDDFWEINDPNPDVRSLFMRYDRMYFWCKLASVEVRWSPKMTLCAGLCVYQKKAGYCSIRLSQPLLKFRPRRDLVQTLLHEMIHAYLFVMHDNRDHDAHGPRFLDHMHRINEAAGANITVYHNFHDEVDVYRQHWWRCVGPCKDRPPFYGYVKRAMNRAPSKNDPWWDDHRKNCSGEFIKIKEPESYSSKGKKRKKVDDIDKKQKKITDFRSVKDEISNDDNNNNYNNGRVKKSLKVIDGNLLHQECNTPSVFTLFSGKGFILGSKDNQPSTSGIQSTRKALVPEAMDKIDSNIAVSNDLKSESNCSTQDYTDKTVTVSVNEKSMDSCHIVDNDDNSSAQSIDLFDNSVDFNSNLNCTDANVSKRNDHPVSSDDDLVFISKKPRNTGETKQKNSNSQSSIAVDGKFVTCPVCHRNDIHYANINEHLDNCLSTDI